MKKFIGNKDFYKLVAALALPLLLQNAVSTFVNLLDNLMVGRIGTESMSGVSIVNQLLFVYNLCLFGGTGGAGIFGAQFFGRGDYNGVRHTLRFNILLCAGFTVIATVLLALIPDTLIGAFLHEAGTGGDLALTLSEGKDYLRIMLFGLPAFCLTTAYVSILRVTGDNRLLYGGGVVYGARDPDDVERLIMPKLLKTFPQLQGVKIDYRWTGNFLLTLSRMPQFGRLDNNIYYMQGYSGHGVTCTHLAGRLISELLRGDAERFDAVAKLPHYPFPGGRSLRIPFTAMGAAYYSLRDRLGV